MSESPLEINVGEWVERARADPVAYQQRQTIEITLNAIAITAPLDGRMLLKGGILMGLAYDSPRQTTDIDLTADLGADGEVAGRIRALIDSALPRASAALGYADLVVTVHSVKALPKGIFEDARFPALKLKVASARRGTRQELALARGHAPVVIDIDISFNETWRHIQVLELTGGNELWAYGRVDLIAEKYRALLQQVSRRRNRRQDVYDLNLLVADDTIDGAHCREILDVFVTKCASRGLHPSYESLDNPEVKARAGADWEAMELELGELPEFEECFARVLSFYRELPWEWRQHVDDPSKE